MCVCVLMWWVDSTMHRFIDAFVDSPIQTMPRFIPRFINVSNGSDVVDLVSFSVLFNLLRSCFVLFLCLLVHGHILTTTIYLWATYHTTSPSIPKTDSGSRLTLVAIHIAIHCGLDYEFRPPISPKIWHENPYPKSTTRVGIIHLSCTPVLGMAGEPSYKGTSDEFGSTLLGYSRLHGCADPTI